MAKVRGNRESTRWGCLALLIIPTLIYAFAQLQSMWFHRQPLAWHLRNTFKESGFEVPDYVSEVQGSKGHVDFFGDYSACVSFTASANDIGGFMMLPSSPWIDPSAFRQLGATGSCGDFSVPAGSFMIEEQEGEYCCKYAVDQETSRVYFWRSSW